MKPTPILWLFDIDGTLLDSGGAGLAALRRGFFTAFPRLDQEVFPSLNLAGATDSGIARILFAHYGMSHSPASVTQFFEAYLDCLEEELPRFRSSGQGRTMPGVVDLLSRLEADPVSDLALLTGNIRAGAFAKLRAFALARHFVSGAFGDDHHDRNELGAIALERVNSGADRSHTSATSVVIGDTPKDIACARAIGALAVTVATGTVDRASLLDHDPDLLFEDLSNVDEVVRSVKASLLQRGEGPVAPNERCSLSS